MKLKYYSTSHVTKYKTADCIILVQAKVVCSEIK